MMEVIEDGKGKDRRVFYVELGSKIPKEKHAEVLAQLVESFKAARTGAVE
jgi:hypothetical protein